MTIRVSAVAVAAKLAGQHNDVRGESLLVGPALLHLPLGRTMLPDRETDEPFRDLELLPDMFAASTAARCRRYRRPRPAPSHLAAAPSRNYGIGAGKVVDPASIGGRKGDFSVERDDLTHLCEGDHLIGFVLTYLSRQSFGQLHLDHGRHQPVSLIGQMSGRSLCSR